MSASPLAAMAGAVIRPGDDRYDEARGIYNLLLDARPALIVRPAGVADVARALEVARLEGYEVAVRSGGHSIAGHGTTDGGLLIDLAGINGIDVDAAGRTAVVGGGVRAGALTTATCAHGLVVPFGDSPEVGVGGITLGGGIGWLGRKYGLTLDSLDRAEVVLADGRVVTTGDDDHPDLFWALRGGGGNFGVVTRFWFRLHPLGPVLGGALALPASPIVLRGLLDLADQAPEELGTIFLVTRLPPLPTAPPRAHGQPAVLITLVWCGDPAEGERHVDRFRRLASPLLDQVRVRPYPEMYSLIPDAPASVTNITSTLLADSPNDLDDHAIEAILDAVVDPGDPTEPVLSAVELRVLGGAIARVPATTTAFAHRRRRLVCSVVAAGMDRSRADHHRAWVRSLADRLAPLSKGAYLNFIGVGEEGHLDEVYPPATFAASPPSRPATTPATSSAATSTSDPQPGGDGRPPRPARAGLMNPTMATPASRRRRPGPHRPRLHAGHPRRVATRRDAARLESLAPQLVRRGGAPAAAPRGWITFRQVLHVHHAAEDDDVWPALRSHLSNEADVHQVDLMVEEHRGLTAAIEAVDAAWPAAPA